jgi:hypothetical protein
MEGMTNKPAEQLAVLARSWLAAPELQVVGGCRSAGYEQAQRSYKLVATDGVIKFRVMASPERPLLNPCFEISDWSCGTPATLTVDGQKRAVSSSFRQGIVRDPGGRQRMLVWVELETTKPVEFTIGGAQPALADRRLPPPRNLRSHANTPMQGENLLDF